MGAKPTDRLENPRNLPYDIDSSHSLSSFLKLIFLLGARDLSRLVSLPSLPNTALRSCLSHIQTKLTASRVSNLSLKAPKYCELIGRRGVKLLLGYNNG